MIKDIILVAPEIREEAVGILTNRIAREVRETVRHPEIAFAVAVQILDDLGVPIEDLLADYDLKLREQTMALFAQRELVNETDKVKP